MSSASHAQTTVAGITPADLSVDQNGAANYSIPLAVPPGVAGMEPSLALLYSSQKVEGILGVGWSLGGLSVVHRCGRTVAQDGATGGIDYSANDRFCLDGQRLVSVNGTYGAAGAEYRTEVETFSKVVSYGVAGVGPASFKVWTRDGRIMSYGDSNDSAVELPGGNDIQFWALNKIEDRLGNEIRFSYAEQTGAGNTTENSHKLVRIDYGGNPQASSSPLASVRFGYELRDDKRIHFATGAKTQWLERLSLIETYSGANVVKRYKLAYDYGLATKRSRLISVTECDVNDNCFTPIDFTYSDKVTGAAGFEVDSQYAPPGYLHDNSTGLKMSEYADVTGDGLPDFVGNMQRITSNPAPSAHQTSLNNGDGTWSNSTTYKLPYYLYAFKRAFGKVSEIFDLNGDGLVDQVGVTRLNNGSTMLRAYLNNGNGWTHTSGYDLPTYLFDYKSKHEKRGLFSDLNGDGLQDLAVSFRKSNGGTSKITYINTGSGWQSNANYALPDLVFDYKGGSRNERYGDLVDVNGDGLPDWVRAFRRASGGTYYQTWLNKNGNWVADSNYAPPTLLYDFNKANGRTSSMIDLNGDGLVDWVRSYKRSNGKGYITTWLNTGKGWSVAADYKLPGYISDYKDGRRKGYFADVNGDGLPDWIGIQATSSTSGYKKVWLNTGTSWHLAPEYEIQDGLHDEQPLIVGALFRDVNGDGLTDLIQNYNATVGPMKRMWINKTGVPDLLSNVSDSLGRQATVIYAPLTDNDAFTKGSNATFPEQDFQNPMQVVAELRLDDGAMTGAGQRVTQYRYSGARTHTQGRGFLGFREIAKTDLQTGNVTTTLYEQDYRLQALIEENRVETASGALKEKSRFTWSTSETQMSGQPSIILAILASAKIEAYEINHGFGNSPVTVTDTSYVYDTYGNPTLITSTTQGNSESFSTVTRNSYGDDPSLWLIGLLTRSELEKSRTGVAATTRIQTWEYNASNGLPTKQVVEPDTPSLKVTTTYSYDAFGNQTGVTVSGQDITSRSSNVTYDTNGQFPTSSTNALNHLEALVTDARFGVVTSLTDPNGITTDWEYDGFGRRVEEQRADGTETRVSYELCASGCPSGAVYKISAQDFLTTGGTSIAGATVNYFDKLNRIIRNETEGFDTTAVYRDTHFNARGLLEKASRAYFAGTAPENIKWIENSYDTAGRRTILKVPDNGQFTVTYNGLTTIQKDPLTQDEIRTVNAINELVSVTDRDNGTVSYSYDAYGDLLETNANGVLATMSYDQRGRKTGMVDPDMGTWSYSYNVLGELISQTDAKNQTVTMSYDLLGRMVTRIEAEGTTTWTYDTATKGIGKIHQVSGPNGYLVVANYDSLGRPDVTTTTISGTVYNTSLTYDALGRPSTITYPSGFAVQNNYTANGFLGSVSEILGGTVYWQANSVDAEGMVTQETLGNGVVTDRAYDPATALLDSIQTNHSGTSIQNLSFNFDTLGNLTHRNDLARDRKEAFTYDGLNRVTESKLTDTSSVTTLNTTTYAYDALGNITNKSDVGAYLYGQNGAGPHAVTTAGANTYSYDANGSMISGAGRTTSWTSFNKPQTIDDTLTGNQTSFVYGPSRARIQQNSLTNGLTTTTTYIGSNYERLSRLNQPDELVHYIRAGGGTVAIYTQIDDGQTLTNKTRYLHKDHLGSVESITDESGVVTEHLSYDAHGKRRLTDWNAGTPAAPSETPRGYTGHEHLDGVGLIHMNGRVYDPTLGRFLSADPNVQAPDSTQSFNRYSYIVNNPLSGTDPSGFEYTVTIGPVRLSTPGSGLSGTSLKSGWSSFPDYGTVLSEWDLTSGQYVNFFEALYGNRARSTGGTALYNRIYGFVSDSLDDFGGVDYISDIANGSGRKAYQGRTSRSWGFGSSSVSDYLHGALTVGSFAPSIIGSGFALLDAGLYALEGNWTQVGIAVGAAAVGVVASAGAAKVAMIVATKVSSTAGKVGAGGVRIASGNKGVAGSGSSSLLSRIRQNGGTLTAPRGSVSAADIAAASRAGGNEIALLRNRSTGERFLQELGPAGGNVPVNSRLVLHTQPGSGMMAAIPSGADRAALVSLGQKSSVIVDSGYSHAIRFGRTTATDNPMRTLPR